MSRIVEYKSAVREIQNYAAFSIVAGLAAVAMGFQGGDRWINGALAVGGALVVADAIWVMHSPISQGVRPLGVALFIIGLFTLGAAGPASSNIPYLGAIFCFAGGYHVLVDYRRLTTKGDLANALSDNPTAEDIAADKFFALVDDVCMTTMATDPQHVQFKTADLFSRLKWDGRFRDADVVLHYGSGSKLNTQYTRPGAFLVPKDDFEIIVGHKHLFSPLHNAKFRFGRAHVPGPLWRHLRGTIEQDSLDRYQAWKASSPVAKV